MLQLTEFSRSQLTDLARGSLVRERYRQQQSFREQLQRLGANAYNLRLPETYTLPLIIQPDESIEGIVYGRYVYASDAEDIVSRGALVVTNKRILLINKKPLYVSCEEIALRGISGIAYTRVGPIGHIILHTQQGDFNVRTFNQQCARQFTEAVETELYNQERRSYDNAS